MKYAPIMTALAALACAASLALPCAMATWEDSRLCATPVARPAVSGTMSGSGRKIPAAYELFRKRLLSGTEISVADTSANPAETAGTLMQKTQALADAGVLPDALAERVVSMLTETREALQCGQDGVSEAVCQGWKYGDGVQSGWRCEAQWLDSCGLVTNYSVMLSASGVDVVAALDAYRSYLGLDTLTDWQPFDVADSNQDTAAEWSASGQIYLYCSVQKGNFAIGAISVTQDTLYGS